MFKYIIAACVLALAQTFPYTTLEENGKCGYESCPKSVPGKLNIHLVPHTHDDVGWLKTVDQYYYGSKSHIQNAGVQYIIDSVVSELQKDPKKKFIYVEIAFFWKWWEEQTPEMQEIVRKLVKNGQLEFIGGAWSMNDEATTHYQSTIDQFTWGFRKLNDTFGTCAQPKIGWQIDPFGHSREMASLMAQLGFDGLFFGRLDFQDKQNRLDKKTMEVVWEGSNSLGSKSHLFTGALFNMYQAPRGFCFDILCGDEPIIDGLSEEANVDRRVMEFMKFIEEQSKGYRSNEILITMGGDFNYQDAHYYFKNLDKLMRYLNDPAFGNNVNAFYSTPSCYVKSLNEANLTWSTKQDDYFPYGSDPQTYWTGYYTSRPTLKYFERLGNRHLQVCKQLTSMTKFPFNGNTYNLDTLREAMGVMQHHDAITGTEKQLVAFDYARYLHLGIDKCDSESNFALINLMAKNDNHIRGELSFETCLLANISDCWFSAKAENFVVAIYNPLTRPVDYFIRLPVSGTKFTVRDGKGLTIPSQIIPIPASLVNIPGRKSKTILELVFKAEAVPELGYRSYYISRHAVDAEEPSPPSEPIDDVEEIILASDETELIINTTSGFLTSAAFGGNKIQLQSALEYYIGVTEYGERNSGAYIFRPTTQTSMNITEKVNITVYKGPIVTEIHQVFSPWASQVIRQYTGDSSIEIEWLVGPLPESHEVISKYTTNIDNKGLFYTDSNGRQAIERKRNYRPSWNVVLNEPVSGNYYPVTTDISLNNGEIELTVLTDRAQGGSSIQDGTIELMVHRRSLLDDGFGVDEPLQEMAYGEGLVARGKHWIIAGNLSSPDWVKQKNFLRQEKVLSPQIAISKNLKLDFETWSKSCRTEFSGLTKAIPPEVQVLTLEPWRPNTVLLRLEHLFEKKEWNENVRVNLSNLFKTFDILSIKETALGADRLLKDVNRLKWKKESNEIIEEDEPAETVDVKFPEIELQPKQIRTFICEIKPKI